jgi:hypothetical protein
VTQWSRADEGDLGHCDLDQNLQRERMETDRRDRGGIRLRSDLVSALEVRQCGQ